MPTLSDARSAFLHDRDLYDLVGRLTLKMVRDETFAEDIRQGAYLVAMYLVRAGRGPRPGVERGWMCRVARNRTYAELRARKEQEPLLDGDDTPDIPVDDHATLAAEQMEAERRLDLAEGLAAKHPDKVALVLAEDGRTKAGRQARGHGEGPHDAAERKSKERARVFLAATLSVGGAGLLVLLVVFLNARSGGVAAGLPPSQNATVADATRELARVACKQEQWARCLDDLEQLRSLDESKLGPREETAWGTAVTALRQEALATCAHGDAIACLEGLDAARRYDAPGDADPSVQAARADAMQRLQKHP